MKLVTWSVCVKKKRKNYYDKKWHQSSASLYLIIIIIIIIITEFLFSFLIFFIFFEWQTRNTRTCVCTNNGLNGYIPVSLWFNGLMNVNSKKRDKLCVSVFHNYIEQVMGANVWARVPLKKCAANNQCRMKLFSFY